MIVLLGILYFELDFSVPKPFLSVENTMVLNSFDPFPILKNINYVNQYQQENICLIKCSII